MEDDAEDNAAREARLRRHCRKLGLLLKKTRRTAGRGHPYHVIEPIRNLEGSGTWYPDGMTLEQAETFVKLEEAEPFVTIHKSLLSGEDATLA